MCRSPNSSSGPSACGARGRQSETACYLGWAKCAVEPIGDGPHIAENARPAMAGAWLGDEFPFESRGVILFQIIGPVGWERVYRRRRG